MNPMNYLDSKVPIRDPDVIARMEMAMELYELAEAMQRQNIRRRNPDLNEDEVEKRLVEWLMSRPPTCDRPYRFQ